MLGVSTVTVWIDSERVAQLTVNASATLKEVMAKVSEEASSLAPYDGSMPGDPVPLLPEQLESTLQSLGWFPSGVLVFKREKTPVKKSSSESVAHVFEAVKRRHDNADGLEGTGRSLKVESTAVADKARRKREAEALKVDRLRVKARGAKDKKTANQLWHMLAKRAAVGASNLRQEDRFYLVVENSPALYVYFSRSTLAGRAVRDICVALCKPENENMFRLRTETKYVDNLLPLAGQVDEFSVVILDEYSPEKK